MMLVQAVIFVMSRAVDYVVKGVDSTSNSVALRCASGATFCRSAEGDSIRRNWCGLEIQDVV